MKTSDRTQGKRPLGNLLDGDSPEVIRSNNEEIKMLRELHERSNIPQQKKRKIRKDRLVPPGVSDDFIAASVLEAAATSTAVSNCSSVAAMAGQAPSSTPPAPNHSKKL